MFVCYFNDDVDSLGHRVGFDCVVRSTVSVQLRARRCSMIERSPGGPAVSASSHHLISSHQCQHGRVCGEFSCELRSSRTVHMGFVPVCAFDAVMDDSRVSIVLRVDYQGGGACPRVCCGHGGFSCVLRSLKSRARQCKMRLVPVYVYDDVPWALFMGMSFLPPCRSGEILRYWMCEMQQ